MWILPACPVMLEDLKSTSRARRQYIGRMPSPLPPTGPTNPPMNTSPPGGELRSRPPRRVVAEVVSLWLLFWFPPVSGRLLILATS